MEKNNISYVIDKKENMCYYNIKNTSKGRFELFWIKKALKKTGQVSVFFSIIFMLSLLLNKTVQNFSYFIFFFRLNCDIIKCQKFKIRTKNFKMEEDSGGSNDN